MHGFFTILNLIWCYNVTIHDAWPITVEMRQLTRNNREQ